MFYSSKIKKYPSFFFIRHLHNPINFINTGSRVLILAFFAASTANNGSHFWLLLLAHCLLMTLTLRPEKEDSDTVREITVTRKFFLALSLVFAQIFAFLPFKSKTSASLHYALYYYTVTIFISGLPDFFFSLF